MSEQKYFYIENGTQTGPVSAEELLGKIGPNTDIWCPGMANWAPANTVPEVAALLGGASAPEPSMSDPAATPYTGGSGDYTSGNSQNYGNPDYANQQQPSSPTASLSSNLTATLSNLTATNSPTAILSNPTAISILRSPTAINRVRPLATSLTITSSGQSSVRYSVAACSAFPLESPASSMLPRWRAHGIRAITPRHRRPPKMPRSLQSFALLWALFATSSRSSFPGATINE